MNYVLVKVSKGIVEEVTFFQELQPAVDVLKDYVETMNVENDDAVVYAPDGVIMTAKEILDEIEAKEQPEPEMVITALPRKPIYIIAAADHHLGFMVASFDDAEGFNNPIEAISKLGQMRAYAGKQLNLYQMIRVQGPLVTREELEEYNQEGHVENFKYKLVEEHIKS